MKEKIAEIRLTKKKAALIDRINEVIHEMAESGYNCLSCRQIYYQLVGKAAIANTPQNYHVVTDAIADGRRTGLIDWQAVEDRTRAADVPPHWNSPEDILYSAAQSFRLDTRQGQAYYIEIWIEKDALKPIISQVGELYDVPSFSCRGFPSISALYDAAQRIKEQGKPCVILYAGDHDASGIAIPESISDTLHDMGANATVERIGLNMEQVKAYNLPENTAKESDKRSKAYIEKYGKSSWELDALPPRTITELYCEAVERYTDSEMQSRLKNEQERQRQEIYALANQITRKGS